MKQIAPPAQALWILNTLQRAGYAGYLVGGCVRDSLLGVPPGDWDIATSALPEQVRECFGDYSVLDTGLQHGTVTLLLPPEEGAARREPYEITTFRVDGRYSDGRRPDTVTFVEDLREDLARRDFTVNALAWSPETGIVDLFRGREDLAARRVACVGKPLDRFREDALRVLRAVRFASTLDFCIAPQTAAAVADRARSLEIIAPERIRVELDKALLGIGVQRAFAENPAVIAQILPELAPVLSKPLWAACLRSVTNAPRDRIARLGLLLRPCIAGAADALRRLRYDNETMRRLEVLLPCLDGEITPSEAGVRRLLNRLGEADTRLLLAMRRAIAVGEGRPAGECDALESLLELVLREGQCYRLADLALKGGDLLEAGIPPGRQLGDLLQHLLDGVLEGRLPNEREVLLREALLWGRTSGNHSITE